jgi:dTDP-4-dehydrorhamnose 3,5-epimerase-like enzyme
VPAEVDVTTIELPSTTDPRGSLSVAERGRGLPFTVERVFVLHDLVPGIARGEHANRTTDELIVCVAGSLTATTDDGNGERVHRLDRPTLALHVPPLVWVRLVARGPGTVAVVAASTPYDPDDAVRDRDELRRLRDGA